MEQSTGLLPIAEVPDACQLATKDARAALVAAEQKLQDDKTYHYWLRQQLALAQNMNEEDCNALAESYQQLMADNMRRLSDSKARQSAIKLDAFSIKGAGRSYMEYSDALRADFNRYVPIPIDPKVEFMEAPLTCQPATFAE